MPVRDVSMSDLTMVTSILTDAFEGHPPATHLFHGSSAAAKLTYFMECSARYALLYGECHAAQDGGGVALWLVPGATRMTPGRMFRAGMFFAPLRFGIRDFRAFGAFAKHTEKVHHEALPEPHYYLLALGVRAGKQGSGVGGRLLRSMLERAEQQGKPVYLETQSEENVPLYERFGFEVATDTTIPHLELRNWGMVRR